MWSTGETTASITVSPHVTTEYVVTVGSSTGCSDTDTVIVNVKDAPIANAGHDSAICKGQEVTLTATGGVSYLWSTGEATSTIIVSPHVTTEYGVVVTSENGCEAIDTVKVSVDEKIVIGDYVFDDVNNNGTQDGEDVGINGVRVKLFTCDSFYGNAHGDLVSTYITSNNPITGAPGFYSFEVCANSGSYYLIFENIPAGYDFATQGIGDSNLDSDVNVDGVTACFEVKTTDDTSIDAGLVATSCGIQIGSKVLPRDTEGIYTARDKDTACIGDDFFLWSFLDIKNLSNYTTYSGADLKGWSFTYEFPNGKVFTQDDSTKEKYRTKVPSLKAEDFGTYKISWKSPDGCHGLTRFVLTLGAECRADGTRGSAHNKIGMVYPIPAVSASALTLVVNTKNQSIENSADNGESFNLKTALTVSKETVSVVIYDSRGKMIAPAQIYTIDKGRASLQYQLGNLATGNYIIHITGEGWSDSKQILIK